MAVSKAANARTLQPFGLSAAHKQCAQLEIISQGDPMVPDFKKEDSGGDTLEGKVKNTNLFGGALDFLARISNRMEAGFRPAPRV